MAWPGGLEEAGREGKRQVAIGEIRATSAMPDHGSIKLVGLSCYLSKSDLFAPGQIGSSAALPALARDELRERVLGLGAAHHVRRVVRLGLPLRFQVRAELLEQQ